ncbi:MAG: Tricarboxylate transport protein TctC [Betaproteobacteria bacterium]|nr:Tricarboxylate transport protein TctC [Betaproteobacteria bacterium]
MIRLFAGLFCAAHMTCAQAAYPERPVELVLPFPGTGSTDIAGIPRITKLARIMQNVSAPSLTDNMVQEIQQTLGAALGQPVNVLRRVRGKTNLGTRYVANAAPDGYTLLFADTPTITVFPVLNPKPPIDIAAELVPVAMFARMPIALITVADRPHESVRDIIERARRLPASINYASAGEGSTSHLTGELFAAMTGARIVHVNYNGSLPAMNAVLTGQVELGFVPLPAVLPYLGGGKIRIVAMASSTRHPAVAGIATMAESGAAGFDASGWFGLFAPARTPSAIVSLLNYDINRALSEDVLQRALVAQGMMPAPGSSEEFRMHVQNDRERWARVLATASIKR